MRDDGRRLLETGTGGAGAVRTARRRIAALAGSLGDPASARRLEAELNDAWLRLQFARLTDDPARLRAERAAMEGLLRAALREGAPPRPS